MIWRSKRFVKALSHPGHAAVLLRRAVDKGPWYLAIKKGVSMIGAEGELRQESYIERKEVTPNIDQSNLRYISFWPQGDKNIVGSKGYFSSNHLHDFAQEIGSSAQKKLEFDAVVPRLGQVVIGSDEAYGDFWGQRPEDTISIPGLSGARQTKLGLNFNLMVEWAASQSSKGLTWKFITNSRNCAGVAVGALKAGGGEAFAAVGGDPRDMLLYTNPNDALHWTVAVFRGVQYVNHYLEMLHNATAQLPPGRPDLMSYQQWRSVSQVSWTIRGQQTTAIDKALQTYHAANWHVEYPKKFKALVEIIDNIRDHMLRRTKRDGAYLELARDVMSVVAFLARSADKPWTVVDFYSKDAKYAISGDR
jgi:hypothetical protein